eukprot:3659313-Rhodomonas_salina.1
MCCLWVPGQARSQPSSAAAPGPHCFSLRRSCAMSPVLTQRIVHSGRSLQAANAGTGAGAPVRARRG